ncbi:MAG: hypothetical protein CMF46_02595 [Legionellales bacterium]|nr:hypothetical protein [Legionellales bacterium]|tara:strand:- start:770 stop:1168 length:399 start_codon:yes stop_codon:yes gene_type:complete
MQRIHPFHLAATLLGILPFLALLQLPHDESLRHYATIITVFLCGTHWGQSLSLKDPYQWRLAASSIVSVLAIWISQSITHSMELMPIIPILAYLLCVDIYLFRHRQLNKRYLMVRIMATTPVIVVLLWTLNQ